MGLDYESLKVRAICADLKISSPEGRLYVYLHITGRRTGEGADYFRRDHPQVVLTLELLLGEVNPAEVFGIQETDEDFGTVITGLKELANSLRRLDNTARHSFGEETFVRHDLQQRLLLYSDPAFRDQHLSRYENDICPLLADYDDQKIAAAIKNEQARKMEEEEQLRRLLGD